MGWSLQIMRSWGTPKEEKLMGDAFLPTPKEAGDAVLPVLTKARLAWREKHD